MSIAKFNTWQNPDGTENYKCRAWVNFNGTGTVAIRAAGNVSSITDNAVGDYTVNFTNAMVDTSYVAHMTARRAATDNNLTASLPNGSTYTTGAVRLRTHPFTGPASYEDSDLVNVSIFR